MPFPLVLPYDIFIAKDSDLRYMIHGPVSAVSAVRTTPAVIGFTIKQIATTDIIYQFPRPG